MRHPCTPGTPPWRRIAEWRPAGRESGSISVMAVFLYLLLAVIGFGLISVSQVYTKFSGWKKDLARLGFAAESGIKQGYEALAARLDAAAGPSPLSDEEVLALEADAEAGGAAILERLAGREDSLAGRGGDEDESWEHSLRFSGGSSVAFGGCFISDSRGFVDSTGTLARRLPRKKASLEFSLRAAAGRIPLFLFPFLVSADPDPRKEDALRNEANIAFAGVAPIDARPRMAFAAAAVLPSDPEPLLKKALQVKLFSPDRLTRAEVRSALGLEMVDEPVPEGVYLVRNSNGLGGVYVQGDLERIILAIEDGWQDVFFTQAGATWCLKFKPMPAKTVFRSPAGSEEFDGAPLGIIMVAGRVASLGGGTVDAAGIPSLQTGDPVPSVLRGVSLTIVATGEVEISSHLVQEGVRWTDSIPYLKDSTSRLSVWAGGNLSLNSASRELHVQASLTSGETISLTGTGRSAVIAGGLQARGFGLGSNRVTIVPDERAISPDFGSGDGPRTAVPLLLPLSLKPLQWNE